MASPRLPTRMKRRARARTRFGWARSERATVGLAAVALGGAGAVLVDQFGRLLRAARAGARTSPKPLIEAAPAAAADTVGVAVRGYAAAPRSETVLFNLLAGFLGSFATRPPLDLGHPRPLGAVPQRQHRRPPHPPLRARHPARLRLGHRGAADRRRRARAAAGGPDGRRHRPHLRRGRAAARPARRLLDPRGAAQRPAQPRRHGDPQHRDPHPADAAPRRARARRRRA